LSAQLRDGSAQKFELGALLVAQFNAPIPRLIGLSHQPLFAIRRGAPAFERSAACGSRLGVSRYCKAMSEQNVEIVQLAFEAIRRRDIEALLELYDADIEFLPLTGTLVESGGYAGHAGVRDYLDEVAHVWEEMRPYAHTTQPVGDHVVVTGGCVVRGIGSGVESDDRMAWVITLRDGKIIRHHGYRTAEEALKAVGL
jgi:ketosteroid isomerase-like protein